MLTILSSTQKPNLSVRGNEENDTHHLKLNTASSSMKSTIRAGADGKIQVLEVDRNDCQGRRKCFCRKFYQWKQNPT